ncbi:MAG: type I restriction-modification system subunit M [Proteobacteria bacterium]|nr:type I restriction-modification system subunit M [Pseudomonadota bacterium]MBU4471310.1 type I restriction-modification system subunit M [Pseudomonadota bacterium]MCG2751685.1 type I restriction-modification system subunit M [Desulfobacteraceae bacterium]
MPQLEHMDAIEKRLWNAADTLRSNSNYASNEYFLPVMGLIFLRHAYSRFLLFKDDIEANLPKRGGKPRPLAKEDFSRKSAIYLRPEAQFDYLVGLKDSDDRAAKIVSAMESIEADYENLRGVLPKSEYQELDNDVMGQLLRSLNPDELKKVSGDVFGRIYEYFLTQFADQKAHDGGEFFTPISLVSLIAKVLEPEGGTVLDPACGSGGMFVQSARFVEQQQLNPAERLTFRGLEKNPTTIRLAKMNLAVHGLEGDIQKAITYYEDPHELLGKADYVMANPPFNVDEIDSEKVKTDPRLPFGLPGVNKKKKVSNGNYIWISYFYSYLNSHGRAGFVMSSQASSAGRDEAIVRQKLIETGDVDIMVAIRSNFFYTRTVPCELWFLNRAKPEAYKDKVLMIDARNIFRKVTRKIYDFSPEQEQNLLAIVRLYRGETGKYLDLVAGYCQQVLDETEACFNVSLDGETLEPLPDFIVGLEGFMQSAVSLIKSTSKDHPCHDIQKELEPAFAIFKKDVADYKNALAEQQPLWKKQQPQNGALKKAVDRLAPLGQTSRDLIKQMDLQYKLASRLFEVVSQDPELKQTAKGKATNTLGTLRSRLKKLDDTRSQAVEQLKQVRYFWKQAHWLTQRFPEARLKDVEGLVKLVDQKEIKANDWSLTPGRYVGVAPEEVDEDFDFEETMRDIHVELEDLNAEAVKLAAIIKKNFEELGI